jgi:ribosomal protein L39E
MRLKEIVLLVACSLLLVVEGKFDLKKLKSMGGKAMGLFNTVTSKVMSPRDSSPPQQPMSQPQMAQQYQQIPSQAPYQPMHQQYPEMYQPQMHQPQLHQQYPDMNQHQMYQEQMTEQQGLQPPGRTYPVQRAYNPKEYYKEFYENEYQDRLTKFIKRLTRIPNFLMTRKERRLLEKLKHKLCHEEREDFEDIVGIDYEDKLYEQELEKHPRGYKLMPLFNDQ